MKIREKRTNQKERFWDILPFLIAGLVSVLWHLTLTVSLGDDLIYFGTLLDGRSIWEILVHRYQTWSSRLAIELILIPLVHHTFLWRILDTIIYASIPVLLSKLLDADRRMRWCITGFVLLYPFSDMVSAGWISTTTNYLWPLWCILFLGTLLRKTVIAQRLKWYEIVGGILTCIYAASQEQVAVILLLLFLITISYQWRRKCYKLPLIYTMCGIDLLSLAAILLCPGNAIRKMQEIEGRMPEFADFTFWDKLYMGLVNVERIFIANLNNIFFLVTAVLAILVYIKTKNYRKTLLSALPVFLLLGQSVIRVSHVRFENIFVIPEQGTAWNWLRPETYLPLLFLFLCIAGILYALFQLLSDRLETYIYTVLLLGCGLASGVIMGFSPTIYASADRPYIYLYFILIFVCLAQIKRQRLRIKNMVHHTLCRLAATVLFLFVLVNISDVLWLCYIMGRI